MTRLIDADALKEKILCDGIQSVWVNIKNAPTVDAVPVIRCKECKWAVKCYGDVVMVDKYGEEIHEPLGMNGYCSMAERREHETD